MMPTTQKRNNHIIISIKNWILIALLTKISQAFIFSTLDGNNTSFTTDFQLSSSSKHRKKIIKMGQKVNHSPHLYNYNIFD